jgi:hypothetical protein
MFDARGAHENVQVDRAAGRKERRIIQPNEIVNGLNSYKGKSPIIETIAFRKGKHGNWSDNDGSII